MEGGSPWIDRVESECRGYFFVQDRGQYQLEPGKQRVLTGAAFPEDSECAGSFF